MCSYNQDATYEETERCASRLLARLRNFETASTCTVDQTYGAVTMTVKRKSKTDRPTERGARKRGQKRGAEEAFIESNSE